MLSMRNARGIVLAATLCMAGFMTGAPASADNSFMWPESWSSDAAQPSGGGASLTDVFGFGATSGTTSGKAYTVSLPASIEPGQIIASFSDRRLYYVYTRGTAISYPIATPRPQSKWQGVLRVSRKQVNPRWTPTPSMRAENPRLPAYVPGGHPKNPLGKRALYLGSSLYRIHGTDAPWTIGQPVSKGCIRMHNNDVADLYNRVDIGTKVTVTWRSLRNG